MHRICTSYASNQDSDGLGRAEGAGWRALCHPLLVVIVHVPPDPVPAPTSGSEMGSRDQNKEQNKGFLPACWAFSRHWQVLGSAPSSSSMPSLSRAGFGCGACCCFPDNKSIWSAVPVGPLRAIAAPAISALVIVARSQELSFCMT